MRATTSGPSAITSLAAAALVGAGGLGAQVVLLSTAGLALGHGRGVAIALALYVAGWSLGAFVVGHVPQATRRGLIAASALAFAAAWVAFETLLGTDAIATRPRVHVLGGVVALVWAGGTQGALLPWIVRLGRRASGNVQAVWVASLVGSVLGAFWIAEFVSRVAGRGAAIGVAGVALLAGAVVACVGARRGEDVGEDVGEVVGVEGSEASTSPEPADARALTPRAAAWLVGGFTAGVLALETATLRLFVLWLGGMQIAIAAHLAASLIALAVGALLVPLAVPRGARGVGWLAVLAALGAAWPAFAGSALDAVHEVRDVGAVQALLLALVLVGPALAPFGAAVPVVFRAMRSSGRSDGVQLGRLLLHESWGALLGGPLITLAVIPALGLTGALAAAALGIGVACAAALRGRGLIPGTACLVAASFAFSAPAPAKRAPRLANPALTFLAFEEDSGFAVSVVDDGLLGERTLLTDGFRAAGDGRDYRYMRLLGHLPVLLHPDPARVCVLALGTGTTVGAVSLHPEVREIEVLELSQAVVDQAPRFERVNRGALEDPRVTVTVGDGRHTLARRARSYDVVTLEPLLADSPFAVYLYTEEFYAAAKRALAPGGLVCQWVPPHALAPEVFDVVVDAFVRSFPRSELWLFDTQLALIGWDAGEPRAGIAPGRFASGRFGPESGEGELAAALRELGVQTPARLAAHRVGSGDGWPSVARRLRDRDPWIVYHPRRAGPDVLGDLARNLRSLGAVEGAPPGEGFLDESQAGSARQRWDGLRALARARAAHAWNEAELRGATVDAVLRPELERELAAAEERLARDDPALVHFTSELAFLDALRIGVSRLAGGNAASALGPLTTAAELRPERGDVHLYLACALQRAGAESAAQAAWTAAHSRCPGILRTPAGLRVLEFGFEAPR